MSKPAAYKKTTVLSKATDKWFVHYLPVTENNVVTIYADGEKYCSDLYDAIDAATQEVCLTGLHFVGDFRLKRLVPDPRKSGDGFPLQELLAKMSYSVDIYLVVNQFWPDEGSVIRNYHKARRDLDKWIWKISAPISGAIMEAGGAANYLPETHAFFEYVKEKGNKDRVHVYCDIHQGYFMHTNHQKTIIVDRKTAFLGGIDLTDIDGDRWDTTEHKPADSRRTVNKPERNWHDIHMRVDKQDETKVNAVDYVYANFLARYNFDYLYELYIDDKKRLDSKRVTSFKRLKPKKKGPKDSEPTEKGPQDYVSEPYIIPAVRKLAGLEYPVVQIVRSMPEGNSDNYQDKQHPKWNKCSETEFERSCRDAYKVGIRAAEKFIYLENQWISDEKIWKELKATAKRKCEDKDFRMVVVLPKKFLAAAGYGRDQDTDPDLPGWVPLDYLSDHVAEVAKIFKDTGNEKNFGMYSILQPAAHQVGGKGKAHYEIPECAWDYIYVHSKIMIVDDCWLLCGSANAGGISLTGVMFQSEPDTELSAIVLDESDSSQIKAFRKQLWGEHLGLDKGSLDDYKAAADEFHTQAAGHKYGDAQAKRVHYNLLYWPVSKKARSAKQKCAWKHLKHEQVEKQIKLRISDPNSLHQTYHNLSAPLTAVHMLLERDPSRYEKMVKDLLKTGKSAECDIDVKGEDLLDGQIDPSHPILEIDWMVGGALVDTTNYFLDYQGTISESVASVSSPGEMSTFMKRVVPCGGGVRYRSYAPLSGGYQEKEQRRSRVLKQANKVSDALRGQKRESVGGKSCPTVFAAASFDPAMLFEPDTDALDKGDPESWENRAKENPFLQLKRDRAYPLYPGVLSTWDAKHIMPSTMYVRILAPIKFHGTEQRKPSHLHLEVWSWGSPFHIRVPTAIFIKHIRGIFVGYYTDAAKKRAEGDKSDKTIFSGRTLAAGKTEEHIHEDIDLTDLTVKCNEGEVEVQISKQIWWEWSVLKTVTLASGQHTEFNIESQSTSDFDLRVRVKACTNARYSLDMKSYD